MADHGPVEYATATGNDLAEHEATYRNFTQLAYVGSCHAACVIIGLAIGGTTGHWLMTFGLIVVASIVAAYCFASGARTPILVMVGLGLVALGLAAAST
jgi:hypothetical protein